METDVRVMPGTPEPFDLPPVLRALHSNLARSRGAESNALYLELQAVGRQLGETARAAQADPLFKTMSLRIEKRAVSPAEAQRLLLASTGPASDGRCSACGAEVGPR